MSLTDIAGQVLTALASRKPPDPRPARNRTGFENRGEFGYSSGILLDPGSTTRRKKMKMDHFEYRQGQLYCEDVPVSRIADDVGTPAYIYSKATVLGHYQRLADAFAELDPVICFSVKSCQNVHICRLLAEREAGFDVVSGGELFRVKQAGGPMEKTVFAGVGKTDAEITDALAARIALFNVESEAELENLIRLARASGTTANAALRVNPDVDPKTPHLHHNRKKRDKIRS